MKIDKKTQFVLNIIENEGLEWSLEWLAPPIKTTNSGGVTVILSFG